MEDHTRAGGRDQGVFLSEISRHGGDDEERPLLRGQHRLRLDDRSKAKTKGGAAAEGQDRLLQHANRAVGGFKLRATNKDIRNVIWQAILFTVAACAMYALQIWLWYEVYESSFSLVIVIAGACALSSLMLMSVPSMKEWVFVVGAFCLQAVLVGMFIGFICYYQEIMYYNAYMGLRTYTNVNAGISSNAFGDGGVIHFAAGSHVDNSRSVGFKSRWDGHRYCVAPVVDNSMSQSDPIYFYAVGVDCCNSRGGFTCGDSTNPDAHASLVLLHEDDLVSTHMKWATLERDFATYNAAVEMHQTYYMMRPAHTVKLVLWSLDPVGGMEEYSSGAYHIILDFSIPYVCIVAVAACISAWLLKPRRLFKNTVFR